MSLPRLDPQRSFFETEEVFARLGKAGGAERFRFFAERIWPQLVRRRPELEKMYCADNGRPAEEPVRMLSVLIVQFMERMPDRQAAEACQYDLRWKLALGMEVDEPAFHATSLVKFRDRLLAHGLERLGFEAVLEEMRAAGYLPKHTKQRLDSTHIIGLVSRMSWLECVRETLRLALEELEGEETLPRPAGWTLWWERYVESKVDYKSSGELLRRKMSQAGQDAWELLSWVKGLGDAFRAGEAVQLLRRVFDENFEVDENGAVEKLRARPETRNIPFVFVASQKEIDERLRSVVEGAEDFFVKPFFVREFARNSRRITARLLQQKMEKMGAGGGTIKGSLSELSVIDWMQSLEQGRKSCTLILRSGKKVCRLHFTEGQVAHATCGSLVGDKAAFRALTWMDGEWELDFTKTSAERTTTMSTQGLMMEGLRLLDEANRDSGQ